MDGRSQNVVAINAVSDQDIMQLVKHGLPILGHTGSDMVIDSDIRAGHQESSGAAREVRDFVRSRRVEIAPVDTLVPAFIASFKRSVALGIRRITRQGASILPAGDGKFVRRGHASRRPANQLFSWPI